MTNTVGAHGRAPLPQAVRDLEDRVGLRTGELEADPESHPEVDPFEDQWCPEPWLPVTDAAGRKGVTRAASHAAIKRGAIIAHQDPDADRLLVSVRSLERWAPNLRCLDIILENLAIFTIAFLLDLW